MARFSWYSLGVYGVQGTIKMLDEIGGSTSSSLVGRLYVCAVLCRMYSLHFKI
jgi:hypothetical protein